MWQDWVVGIILWIFAVSLVPTILHASNKPAFSTSLLTSLGNFVMAYVFATLDLWNGSLAALAIAIAWSIITVQRWRLDNYARGKP